MAGFTNRLIPTWKFVLITTDPTMSHHQYMQIQSVKEEKIIKFINKIQFGVMNFEWDI